MSFQSRLGREEWLKPYTAVRLSQLPSEGVKKLNLPIEALSCQEKGPFFS